MKTTKLIFILLFFVGKGFAQADKYSLAMKKGLAITDSAQTAADFTNAANYFERIAAAEEKKWLPQYYTAFSNLYTALTGTQNAETKDALYDKALKYAEKAELLMPGNSDIYALKAYITFMKMSVSPQARAMSMIPAANALAEKAIALDPENPRAYLVKGQNLFYTPEMFGGGKVKAKAVLVTADEKFETAKDAGIEPYWGKSRCKTLLSQVE